MKGSRIDVERVVTVRIAGAAEARETITARGRIARRFRADGDVPTDLAAVLLGADRAESAVVRSDDDIVIRVQFARPVVHVPGDAPPLRLALAHAPWAGDAYLDDAARRSFRGSIRVVWRYDLPAGVEPIALPEPIEVDEEVVRIEVVWRMDGSQLVNVMEMTIRDEASDDDVASWLAVVGVQTDLDLTWTPLEHLESRDPAGAVGAARELVERNPTDVDVLGLQAQLWARLGLVDVAIASLPTHDLAYWRGCARRHNPAGRDYTLPFDGTGAAADFGVAGRSALRDFALGSAQDGHGRWFGTAVELAPAVAALRLAWDAGHRDPFVAGVLAEALVRTGQPEEANAFVGATLGVDTVGGALAATALVDGVDAAVRLARTRVGDSARDIAIVLARAWWVIAEVGRYDVADALASVIAATIGETVEVLRVNMLGRPVARATLPAGSAARALADVVHAALAGEDLTQLVCARNACSVELMMRALRGERSTRSDRLLADLVAGAAEVAEEVPKAAAYVTARVLATDFEGLFVWEDDRWRYRAGRGATGDAAQEALARYEAGDTDGGDLWARWTVDLWEGPGWSVKGFRARGEAMEFFTRAMGQKADMAAAKTYVGELWRDHRAHRDPKLRTAMLTAVATGAGGRVELFAGMRPEVELKLIGLVRGNARLDGVAEVAWIERWADLSDPIDGAVELCLFTEKNGQIERAREILRDLCEQAPDEPKVMARKMFFDARFGEDPDAVLERARGVLAAFPPDANSAHAAAELLLFGTERDVFASVGVLERAAAAGVRRPGALLALAVGRVMSGDVMGALDVAQLCIHYHQALDDNWAIVRGLVAESVELTDAAVGAYRAVPLPDRRDLAWRFDYRELAERGLARIGAEPLA